MRARAKLFLRAALWAVLCSSVTGLVGTLAGAQTQPAAAAAPRIGVVKAIEGNQITFTPDSGPQVTITVQDATRFLRIAPGEKNLKNATPMQLRDLQIGDRIMIGSKPASDGGPAVVSTVVVMKRSDLDARHQQELQDWQKRGVDGPAADVNTAAGTVTITVGALAAKKNVVIHTSPATVIRRYSANSVKFDDAKASSLQELHSGDQVRARGERNTDGSEIAAEEIVFGSFRNIAGTINSVDASASTVDVHDLISKKSITVKVTPDSQLRGLPPEMAQRIAARLKAAMLGGASAEGNSGGEGKAQSPPGGPGGGPPGSSGGMGGRGGGPPDLQRMLSRLPAGSLNDLHKGDAVVVLSTEDGGGPGSVVTLLTGVEPILQAAPGASGASILTPWSLGAPAGDAGGP